MYKIWSIKYNIKNIKLLIETSLSSALAANFLAPIIIFYTVHLFYSVELLVSWMTLHLLILFARLAIRKKIIKEIDNRVNYKYVTILLYLTSFTSLLYALVIWASVIQGIPSEYIFMLSAVLIALSAGAVSTLMSVFHFFAIFVLINMLSTISAVIYYGQNMFYIYALLLVIFTVIFIQAGYRQYTLINNLILLKDSFQAIYDKSSDGIALIKGHKYKDCNPAILKMFQFDSKKEFLTTHVTQLMPKYQENGVLSIREMLLYAKKTFIDGQSSFEWIYKKKDGTLFWTEIVLTKINIDGEELIHGVYRDITVKKELEKEKAKFQENLQERISEEVEKNRQKEKTLLHQSKLAQMGEMISMIAHQWRQPLSAISSLSQALNLKATLGTLDNETIKRLSDDITEYSQHLSSTIDDFREFFRPKKEAKETNFGEIIESVLKIVESSLITKNIRVVKQLDCQESFTTHPNEIKQVVLNIIKNAEDALVEIKLKDPSIKIHTYSNDHEYILEISDNAGGIPVTILESIFEPYFSTKTQKDGTGLGLYMSKTIIEEHCKGELNVQNTTEGALFKIILHKKENL